jgi:hypothetical protein
MEGAASALFNIHFRNTEEANPPASSTIGSISELYVDNMRIQHPPILGTGTTTQKQEIRGNVKNGITYLMKNMIFTDLVIGNEIITEENKDKYFNIGQGTQNIRFMKLSTFYNVNVTVNGNGKVHPHGNQIPVRIGNNQTFNIVPHWGNRIKDVKVNGVSIGRRQHLVIESIKSDQQIEIDFEAGDDFFDLTVSGNRGIQADYNDFRYSYSNGTLYLRNIGNDSGVKLSFYDLMGKEIVTGELNPNDGGFYIGFLKGIYLIRIENQNTSFTGKIIL